MISIRARLPLAGGAVLLAGTAVALAATPSITPTRAGAVRLGATYQSLHAAGLLGKVAPGCELAGPSARSAPLRAPLKGSVALSRSSPRRVASILLRGGATARGVGIGARSGAIRAAFPTARFDHSSDAMFGITLVRVPKSGGGSIEFALDTRTRRVTLIGVPAIAFCE